MNIPRIVQLVTTLKETWEALRKEVNSEFDLKVQPRGTSKHQERKTRAVLKEELLQLFRDNPERGFTTNDIFSTLKFEKRDSMHRVLHYLKAANLIEKVGDAYRLSEEARLKHKPKIGRPKKIVLDGLKKRRGRPAIKIEVVDKTRTAKGKKRKMSAEGIRKFTLARRARAKIEAEKRQEKTLAFLSKSTDPLGHTIQGIGLEVGATANLLKKEMKQFAKNGLVVERTVTFQDARGHTITKKRWFYTGGGKKNGVKSVNGTNGVHATA